MQRSTKPWALLVVIIVLAFLAWIFFGHHGSAVAPVTPPVTQTEQSTAPATVSGQATSDNSDAAIGQDMTNVDAQMKGLDSDNASADQGLNQSEQ